MSKNKKFSIKEWQDGETLNEGGPGLWANIRAKRASGKPMSKKGSKAFKAAKKAGDKINKEVEEHVVSFTDDDMSILHSTGKLVKSDESGKDHTYMYKEIDSAHKNEDNINASQDELSEADKHHSARQSAGKIINYLIKYYGLKIDSARQAVGDLARFF